jgi:hypothetical protein
MKKIGFVSLMVFTLTQHSQTLTQSFNEPKPGDLETNYVLDTSSYSNGLPLQVTGTNAVWNFKDLKGLDPVFDNYYLSASSVATSSNYTGCTFVQESANVYTYFKSVSSPTTQTELLGLSSSSLSLLFSNTAIVAKYPITFGSTITDNLSGTFTGSLSGTCAGSLVTSADGFGTLNLPNGVVFTNVLRVKSVQTVSLTSLFTQVATIKQNLYNFYHSSQKFPILSINYSTFTSIISPVPSISGGVTGSLNYFATGMEEQNQGIEGFNVYPNPAKNHILLSFKTPLAGKQSVELYSLLGQKIRVYTIENPSGELGMDVSGLPSGIYLIKLIHNSASFSQKLIIE